MAKTRVVQWDETASNNTDVGGIDIDEGCAPSGMNNAARETMAQISRLEGDETIPSATTTDLGSVDGRYITLSGTTTITGLGTVKAGTLKFVTFSGILTLTHNATSLILKGGANRNTVAGDSGIYVSLGSGNWRELAFDKANGEATVPQVIPASAGKLDVRRNRIVNGDMTKDQENEGSSGTANGYYAADQWATYRVNSAGTITSQRVSSLTPAGGDFRYRVTITAADASIAAGEFLTISTNLEGSNVTDFNYGVSARRNSVLRFGFKGPAGTYAIALHNSANNRSYVALFTITGGQANTDTLQELSIPGDSTGTWLKTDGVIGITLDIVLAAGTTFRGATGWQAGNILATSAISNGMGTAGAIFELFDVGLRLDPDATGVYGQYEVGETDAVYRAERYYQKTYEAGVSPGTATTLGMVQATFAIASVGRFSSGVQFTSPLNKPPSLTLWDGAGNLNRSSEIAIDSSSIVNNIVVTATLNVSTKSFICRLFTDGNYTGYVHYAANARLS